MPEGPSIVILKEEVQKFKGKIVKEAGGNSTKIDFNRITGKKVIDFKSWGKHFLICFKGFTIRVHFLLFGSYRIDEQKETSPRLSLKFTNGELNLYACSVLIIEENLNDVYDWTGDVMNEKWSSSKAKIKLKEFPKLLVCDALLDQHIFAGVGNIIKNEVLYRIKVHPESIIEKLPPKQLNLLVKEAVNYSYDFLKWKKEYTLRKHWLVHTKKNCLRCSLPIHKKYCGKTNRRTFFCENCQVLYR
jgi:endonuclease-8